MAADKHAGHLNVTLPTNHPFYVENKGWCQINPKHAFFKTLLKMDTITNIEEDSFFQFDEEKDNAKEKEKVPKVFNVPIKLQPRKPGESNELPDAKINLPKEVPPPFLKPEMYEIF